MRCASYLRGAIAGLLLNAGALAAAEYPSKTIELVVAGNPGGGLDLVAPIRLRTRELLRFAWYAFGRGDRSKEPNLLYAHDADRIEIVCDVPMPLEVDGEDLGDVEHVVVEAERDAITVLV